MLDGEVVASYLTRLSHVRDELVAIGDNVPQSELVRTALKGSKECKPYIKGIVACDKLLDWNRLWDDFIQEEL